MSRFQCSVRLALRALALPGLTLLAPAAARAQTVPAKLTVNVTMRDGKHLATDIYLPAGAGPWPVALARTSRGKATVPAETGIPASTFRARGIVLVAQDVRGLGASQGAAIQYLPDGWGTLQDGADTVAWIRQQPWSNGKIATFGTSDLGIAQLLLAGAGPEGIVGQHVGAAPLSLYQYLFFQSGVLRPTQAEFLPTPLRQHPQYDDAWRGLDLGTRLDQVRWPIVHVGGWFDMLSQGTIDAFTRLQEAGGEGARGRQHLVIGPWTHFGNFTFDRKEGELRFPANAGYPSGAPTRFQWLSFWLTGQPQIPADEPVVRYYVMGDVTDPQAPGNTWRTADRWPPPSQPLRLYFSADGGLEREPPAAATTRSFDDDPAHPVPTIGGQVYDFSSVPAGPRDQRPVEGRPDVLLFSTPPLGEPLEVTGRLSVRLYASSSARDTDFTAKLTDVYPDGRSMLVADGIVRARHRLSLTDDAPITPGERTAYDIDLWSTSIVFNRGHRIRVAISSSNAPRFEPNPNTWPDQDVTPVVAHQTITLGGPEASHIVLPEVVGSGSP